MNEKTTAPDTTTAPPAPAPATEQKISPAVKAVHDSCRAQAQVETRFDATRFRRKEQK